MHLFRVRSSAARGLAGLAVLATASLGVAACGSSSSSGSGASSASLSNAANVTSGGVAAAEQVANQAMTRPTSITVKQPIGKPVPTGKKIVFISCGVQVCALQGNIVAQAASQLGWTSSTIATDGSPAQVQNAYETALRSGADGIVTTAALRAEISGQIPQLLAKHVVVSDSASTDPVSAPFIYNTSTASQNAVIGKYLAAEIVANSKGKANTLYVNLPAYSILAPLGASLQSYYKQYCPTCGYASVGIAITQLSNAPSTIVSYIRSHPNINYVALSVADALSPGLPAALSAAGLSNVKIVGQGGGPIDFQAVADGQELALVPDDHYAIDYQMVDALARHFAGVPVQMTPPPLWLMTKANLPSNHSQVFPVVADNQAQFLKLWGK
jgi:ribose transport system substrate-binding protein